MFESIKAEINYTNLSPILICACFFLEVCAYFAVSYSIAKYVFFEKFPSSKKWKIYYLIVFLISAFIYMAFGQIGLLVMALGLLVPMLISRKKYFWVVLLEMFPWLGISEIFIYVPIDIPNHFISDILIKYIISTSWYGFILLSLIGLVTIGKKWRKRFDSEISKRNLATWERVMLIVIGCLLVIYPVLKLDNSPFDEVIIGTFNSDQIIFINSSYVAIAVACFMLGLIAIIVVTVSNKKSAYQTKVVNMQSNIISMMAEIIENRDENTGGHIQRTAKYVEIIARQLQEQGMYKKILTNDYINDMKVAAPLHDIGKIHVSDLILNKPGKLEPEEFEIMKTHAAEGKKLLLDAKEYLGDFNYLDIAVDMAGSHHEWWNGSSRGYPDHKKGTEIPLCARIMAVADVFDALTSKRCYRDAMVLDKAYSIIREERGTHFDEVIVDAFFAAKEKIEAALDTFSKE